MTLAEKIARLNELNTERTEILQSLGAEICGMYQTIVDGGVPFRSEADPAYRITEFYVQDGVIYYKEHQD